MSSSIDSISSRHTFALHAFPKANGLTHSSGTKDSPSAEANHFAVLAAVALITSGFGAAGVADVTSSEPSFAKSDNAPVNQVSGGGTVDVPAGRSTYTFHASKNGANEVKGGFQLHFSSVDVNVSGDVTCLIVNGNFARMTGVVTNSSNETLMATGTRLHWQAVDNGEEATPSRIA